MSHKKALKRAIGMSLAFSLLGSPFVMPADVMPTCITASVAEAAAAVGPSDVVLVGTVQSKLGAGADWAPGDGTTIMKDAGNGKYQYTGKLPKGNYEYKIAIGGTWDTNYGADGAADGANMKLKLTKDTEVTFTYDSATHKTTVSYAGQGSAEEKAATTAEAARPGSVQPTDVVLVGSLQDELGAAKEWDPADGKTIMKSDGAGHHVFTGHLPKGNYDFKIAVGGSWDVNYGANGEANGKNIALRLLKDHDVTFTYDDATHAVTYDYAGKDAEEKALAAEGRSIVLTGTVQSKAGAAKDWDPSDTTTRMKAIGHDFYSYKIKLPAGTYYYKISVNGSWAENYGLGGNFDGANVQLTLPKAQEVTFYYNDKSHHIADSTSYTFRADKDLPVLSGSFGAVDDPLMRDQMLDNLFQKTIPLQKGDYTVTVKMPGEDALTQQVNVAKDGDVTFYYDSKAKRLIADDGRIREDKVYHDSWSTDYRAPFEAVKEGTPVKLSLATGKGDVTSAKLVVYKAKITANGGDEYNPDYTAGTVTSYPMTKASTSGDQDIWTASFTPTSYGLYGYKFVLNDTKEYGDDAKPGSTGELKLRGVKPYQLTVYSKDYKTPDWAKDAVCYQIFPDRFFNGDKSNDNARANARGFQPVQHRKWSDLPANYSKTPAADGDKWECNDFFGGDIAGITKKLDYLQGLGVTAIYVNPIYDASSNHRYDAVDYGTIDPFLGNFKDLEKLSAEMQKRGMHLIMDGVYNHIGDDSIYFDRYGKYKTVGAYEYWSRIYDLMNDKHMTEAAAKVEAKKELEAEGQVFSPWHWENWFDIRNEKTQDMMGKKYAYHDWQGYDSLVPFKDADYPGSEQGTVKSDLGDYLLYGNGKDKGVIMKWFDEGLDGWRLDVAKEVPPGFWANVRKEVKSIKTKDGSEPLLLGEIWQDGSQFFTGDTFDSVMNYKLSFALGDLFLNKGDAKAADYELTVLRQNYPKEAFYDLMNIVDSHDTVRAIYKFGGGSDSVAQPTKKDFDYNLGKARLKLAATFLMGYPGMPTIYYGDEAGQYGSGDPDCRRTYPWGKEDKDLIAHYKKVIGVRNAHKDIFARGDVNTLKAEGDIYAFSRKADSGKLGIVALNRGKAQQVTLPVSAADGTTFTDELTGTKATANGGQLTLALGENQGMMLVED